MAANAVMNVPVRRKERKYQEFMRVDLLNEREIRERFRFGREGINFLCDLLKEKLERSTKRSRSLSVQEQVLTALRFYASGSFLQCVGDAVGLDKSTVSRVISDVTDALVDLRGDFIKWPTSQEEKRRVRQGFYRLGGFPNVIGCIDGTHIRIQAPTEDEKSYVNRKNYHSINVMGVCNDKGIVNINLPNPSLIFCSLPSKFLTKCLAVQRKLHRSIFYHYRLYKTCSFEHNITQFK